MVIADHPVAQRLLESIVRFRRLSRGPTRIEGLTRTELMILLVIKDAVPLDGDGIKVSTLSTLLQVAAPTVTQQINSLARQGCVVKGIDSIDRRAVRIRLTDKGRAALDESFVQFVTMVNRLFAYLGEEDSDELARLLTRVFTYLHETGES